MSQQTEGTHVLGLTAMQLTPTLVSFANYSEVVPAEAYAALVGEPASELVEWFANRNPDVVVPDNPAIFIDGSPIAADAPIPNGVVDVQIMAAKRKNG